MMPIEMDGVSVSGQHVYVESGVYIASGIHVVAQSGVHVVTDIEVEVSSGIWVDGVSGQHVYVESGAFVQISGQHVIVSGVVATREGLYDVQYLSDILEELKKINIQLNLITSNEISKEDID